MAWEIANDDFSPLIDQNTSKSRSFFSPYSFDITNLQPLFGFLKVYIYSTFIPIFFITHSNLLYRAPYLGEVRVIMLQSKIKNDILW